MKSELQDIFTPLFKSQQSMSRKMNVSGHGLGLSICKHICESLGGYI